MQLQFFLGLRQRVQFVLVLLEDILRWLRDWLLFCVCCAVAKVKCNVRLRCDLNVVVLWKVDLVLRVVCFVVCWRKRMPSKLLMDCFIY